MWSKKVHTTSVAGELLIAINEYTIIVTLRKRSIGKFSAMIRRTYYNNEAYSTSIFCSITWNLRQSLHLPLVATKKRCGKSTGCKFITTWTSTSQRVEYLTANWGSTRIRQQLEATSAHDHSYSSVRVHTQLGVHKKEGTRQPTRVVIISNFSRVFDRYCSYITVHPIECKDEQSAWEQGKDNYKYSTQGT